MTPIIIGLSGKAQAGKDTIADMLIEIIRKKTKKPASSFHIANLLKHTAKNLFSWNGDKELYEEQDKGRNLLINIGLKMREIRPTVWIDSLINDILYNKYFSVIIVPDVRYKTDFDGIIKAGGIVGRVDRQKGQLDIDNISEKELDNETFAFTIINNAKDLKELETIAEATYEHYIKESFPIIKQWEKEYQENLEKDEINFLRYKKGEK